MNNFMKTIINAVKSWTNGRIKDSAADWNENDSNSDSYIKNRTHYEDKITIVDNLTYEDYDNGNYPRLTFVIGQSYDVIWNGVLYENIVCNLIDDWRVLDDGTFSTPFYIDDDGGDDLYISANDDSNFTVSILTQTIHKIDKKYLPDDIDSQPDWNQNDETQSDYIKNRPFYEAVVETAILEGNYTWNSDTWLEFAPDWEDQIDIIHGKEYRIRIDGIDYYGTTVDFGDDGVYIRVYSDSDPDSYIFEVGNYSLSGDFSEIGATAGKESFVGVYLIDGGVKQLDEKFIPDSIQRTGVSYTKEESDEKYLTQSDWNQNDDTQLGYIKNRTHYVSDKLVQCNCGVVTQNNTRIQSISNGGQCPDELYNVLGQYIGKCVIKVDGYTLPYGGSNYGNHYFTFNGKNAYIVRSDGFSWIISATSLFTFNSEVIIECVVAGIEVHQLDEKYIPDSIARISDIPKIESDWNQNDETHLDYIKNRTHYEHTEQRTIRYDNSISYETLDSQTGYDNYIKLSDVFLPKEFLVGQPVTIAEGSWVESLRVTVDKITDYGKHYTVDLDGTKASISPLLVVCEDTEINSIPISVGVYSLSYRHGAYHDYVQNIYYLYTELKTLDEKYIPSSIARVDDVEVSIQKAKEEHEHNEYVTEEELNTKSFATEAYVANKIAEAQLAGEEVDLSGYATKDDIKDFITEVPSEYITESELNAKGYLTQHQDLSSYAKKTDIPEVPVKSVNGKTGNVQLSASEVGALPADTKIPTKVSELTNDKGYLTEVPVTSVNNKTGDVKLSASDVGALPSTYTPPDQTAEQVGADAKGTAESKVSTHNVATDSHNDIRLLISGLTTRLNALADSTDTDLDQMSEIVAYIKANKELIEGVTTNKVNVSDIINNLTTNVSNKPLSAAQGVALKGLIDAIKIPTKLSELSGDSTHRTVTDTEREGWSAKANVSDIPTKTSQLTNDSNFLTSVPSEYVTETELANKKYLTSVPSEYVTDNELNTKLSQKTQVQFITWEDDD